MRIRGSPSGDVTFPPAAEALEPRRLLAVHLVKDINLVPFNGTPSAPFEIGSGVALFTHATPATHAELYRTDGTPEGTYPLKDIFPGQQSSQIRDFVRAGDIGYFLAHDGPDYMGQSPRYELWRSDGTEAGTFSVLNNDPNGPRGGGAVTPVGPGRRAFFLAEDGPRGMEWWLTNGAPDDAEMVTDLVPGEFQGLSLNAWGTQGTVLLFQSRHRPTDLYASDGTAAGTVVIASGVEVQSGLSNVSLIGYSNVGFSNAGFVRVGNLAYFVDRLTGSLWRTDGTAAGTRKVVDRAMPDLRLIEAVSAGDALFFAAMPSLDEAMRVFRYDPVRGFSQVTPPSGQSSPRGANWPLWMTPVGDTVYFNAVAGQDNRTLYRVAPGSSIAAPVPDLPSYTSRYGAFDLTRVGETLYFRANDADLWKVTGPGAPATRVTRLPQAQGDPYWVGVPTSFGALGNKLLLAAFDPVAGYELHRSDGTAEGTKLINDTSPTTMGAGATDFAPFAGGYLFSADDGVRGREPHFTDGTTAGTYSLGDLVPGRAASNPRDFTAVQTPAGPRAFFAATDGGGAQLWVTDGTPRGTRRVKVIDPSPFANGIDVGSVTAGLGPAEGLVYFAASDGTHGYQVWRSDGTEAGTYRVADVHSAEYGGAPGELTALADGSLLFTAADTTHGVELWRTDGTAAGTRMLKDIRPDPVGPDQPRPGSQPGGLSRIGPYVYFAADDLQHGRELWRTDGTTDGTVIVADIDVGSRSSNPGSGSWGDNFVEFGGNVYFAASTGRNGAELWRTDGTVDGTMMVKDVIPGTQASAPNWLRAAPDRLYFVAGYLDREVNYDPPRQVWSTDGTGAGTTLAVTPDVARNADQLSVVGGRLFFRASMRPTINVQHSSELFTTDGTPAGTRRLSDLGRVNWTSNVSYGPMALPDGSILVTGDDGVVSGELLRYDNPWVSRVVGRHVFYNRSIFDGDDPAPDARDDGAIAGGKSPRLIRPAGAPQDSAFFTNVTSYTRGINGVMVDLANLPEGVTLTADDFDFGGASAPASVAVRRGAGVDGSDRVTLVWDDYGVAAVPPSLHQAVGNGWLYVTVKATARTGLVLPDVFAFGNLIGDSGDNNLAAFVNALDVAAVKRALGPAAGVASRVDFNRDGAVNALDLAAVKQNLTRRIPMPLATAPLATAPPPPSSASSPWGAAAFLATPRRQW